MPRVLMIGVPDERARTLEARLDHAGCLVRRLPPWPVDHVGMPAADIVIALTSNPAALCLAVRRVTMTPLLVLTDADSSDRVAALTCGADICLGEGESDRVVLAHILALLRRWIRPVIRHGPLKLGRLDLDPAARRAAVDGERLDLRPREFDLLMALARAPGRAFRRPELLDLVWGPRFTGGVNTVDVHVSWLRQKLPQKARLRITTLRGVGYRLDELDAAVSSAPRSDTADHQDSDRRTERRLPGDRRSSPEPPVHTMEPSARTEAPTGPTT